MSHSLWTNKNKVKITKIGHQELNERLNFHTHYMHINPHLTSKAIVYRVNSLKELIQPKYFLSCKVSISPNP